MLHVDLVLVGIMVLSLTVQLFSLKVIISRTGTLCYLDIDNYKANVLLLG